MWAGYSNGKAGKLYFFDNDPIKSSRKRHRKPTDSLHPVKTGVGGKIDFALKYRRAIGFNTREKTRGGGEFEEPNLKREGTDITNITAYLNKKTRKSRVVVADINFLDEEDEDIQLFLFEETKFLAPNILAQLEKFLNFLITRRNNERKEIQSLNQEIQEVYGKTFDQNAKNENQLLVIIPDDLYKRLLYDFEQLITGVIYTKREWQTATYREMASMSATECTTAVESQEINQSSPQSTMSKTISGNKVHEADEKNPDKSRDKKNEEVETSNPSLNALSNRESNINAGNGPLQSDPSNGHTVGSIRRESRMSQQPFPRARTRAERFKYFGDKEKGRSPSRVHQINFGPHESFTEEEPNSRGSVRTSDDKNYILNTTFTPASVINFSMSSKSCQDNGWIIRPQDSDDVEHKSILEWARSRLKQAMKLKEEEEARAKLQGEYGEIVFRYYGDSKREVVNKYKQGVIWTKGVNNAKDEKRKKFLIVLPDRTSNCYYPSGRLAICVSKAGLGIPGFYTLVFSNENEQKMLACFTPTGKGGCYYKNNQIKFVSSSKLASFQNEEGNQRKKWKWAYGKLMNPEAIQLNQFITVRCVSQTLLTIYVNIEGENAKYQVGHTQGAVNPIIENLGYLMTSDTITLTSNAAIQSIKPKKRLTRDEKRARAQQQRKEAKQQANGVSEVILAERAKELEEKFPERKDIEMDVPYLLELYRLQRKVKNVLFEWMEHYRVTIGIVSPARAAMLSRRRKQKSHSASSRIQSTEERLGSPRPPRAPSAPPLNSSLAAKLNMSSLKQFNKRVPASETQQESPIQQRPRSSGDSRGTPSPDYGTIRVDIPIRSRIAGLSLQKSPPPEISARAPRLSTKDGCPTALRLEMIGAKECQCRCDKRRIPVVTDAEYDSFINRHVSQTQLIVVCIVSSRFPDATPCDNMLDELYYDRNKNRTFPCVECRYDSYRLVRYDMSTANEVGEVPLLLRRHNAVPGMFLLYIGGKLLFADYIFNGYGNAKKDFLKQVMNTRKDALKGHSLEQDFRFSPSPSRRGPRTAWGGEIGTPILVNVLENSMDPNVYHFKDVMQLPHILSVSSGGEFVDDNNNNRKHISTADFISLGLSSNPPFQFRTTPTITNDTRKKKHIFV